MQPFYNACVLLLVLVLQSIHGNAQTDTSACTNYCCCSNDPTPAGVMISHVHTKGEWMLSYRYMNMSMNGIKTGTTNLTESDVFANNYLMAPMEMQMSMHMLMGMYGLTDKLTLMAMFNYNSNYMKMAMGTTHHHNMNSSGISDFKLNALYAILQKPANQILVSLGASLPTGSVNLKGQFNSMMYPNQRFPYATQLGSGTFDVMPCVNYLTQRNNLFFSSQASAIVRTNFNTVGYKYGNELSFNNWLAWQWLPFISSSLRVEAITSGTIKGGDATINPYEEPSANTANYGGQKVNGYLGSSLQFKKGALRKNKLSFEYSIPCYEHANGIQMNTKRTLLFTWALTF